MPVNPFNPGVYSPIQGIFGREEQLRLVDQVIAKVEDGDPHSPVCFIGPQGLGKTFLLKSIASELRARHWLCGYTEAGPDIGSAIYDILADARQLAPRRRLFQRALSRITGFSAAAGPVSIGLDIQSIDDGSAYSKLAQLFEDISNRARLDFVGAALLLDEAQALPGAHLNHLFRALAAIEQSSIVLFMAALPGLANTISLMPQSVPTPSWITAVSTPYVRFSDLEALDQDSARSVLLAPVDPECGEFEEEAVSALVSFGLGHPLTLQMLGQSAWNIADSVAPDGGKVVIRGDHAGEAIAEVAEQLRVLYHRPTWRNCSEHERAMLRKIASLGGMASEQDLVRPVKSSGKNGSPDPTATVYGLVDRGILYDDLRTRTVRIVMPGFREFIVSA